MRVGTSFPASPLRQELLRVLLLVVGVVALGTLGYTLLEPDWGPVDALYMTVITVSTVGFGEVRELSDVSRLFTLFLILAGVTTGYFAASTLGRAVLGSLPLRAQRRMHKLIDQLSDHVILCGYGRLGAIVRRELETARRAFVVIDSDPEIGAALAAEQVLVLTGDATDEEVLLEAGVKRASGVIACVSNDAGNLFITLTTRQHNPACAIVARAEDPRSEAKLRRVGATSVVTPYALGGKRLAQALLRPSAVNLAEMALGETGHEVFIEEVRLPHALPDSCSTLAGLQLGARFGLIAVAVREAGGRLRFNPRAETPLQSGAYLLLLGERDRIDAFQAFMASTGAAARG